MNLNSLQLVGLILIIAAFGAQALVPGTIVYYSTVAPSMLYVPSNTTPNSPQYIPAYDTFMCIVMLQGIQIGEVLNVSVQISQWTGSAWTIIGTYALSYLQTVNGVLEYEYDFSTGGPGILYSLSYAVVTIDVRSFQGIGYIQTAVLNGYFTINGIPVNSTSKLRVTSPTLQINYTLTTTGISATILSGYVKVLNGSGYLIQTVTLKAPSVLNPHENNLTATYTLPGSGTFTLNGYITYAGTTTQQMSIIGAWGDNGFTLSTMSFSDIYVVMGIFGVLFVIVGARKKKQE